MDKYEYQAKLEEINKLAEKQDYDEAVQIADTIEWKRVRSVKTLCMISEIYEAVGRAEDSKAILYRAYRRSPNSRQILYRLTEACVQTQEFDDAVEYYTEYVNVSPNDNSKYILKYEIYKGRGSSLEEQIGVLEELKSKEYSEQWAYELAKLYDEAGMVDQCVAECDDLALWFHNGKYVVQALELKKKYKPLTPEQQTVYDNPSEIVDMETKEEVVEKAVPTLDKVITKELPQSEKDVIVDSIITDTAKQIAAVAQTSASEAEPEAEKEASAEAEPVKEERPAAPARTLDTVELQSELANSMREILSGIRPAASSEELESAPVMERAGMSLAAKGADAIAKAGTGTVRREEPEEEQLPGQMSIDDLLTGAARETTAAQETVMQKVTAQEAAEPAGQAKNAEQPAVDFMSAPTIDLSKKIEQEIGKVSVRDYAAHLKAAEAAKAAQPEKTTAAAAGATEAGEASPSLKTAEAPEIAPASAQVNTQEAAPAFAQANTQEAAPADVQAEAPAGTQMDAQQASANGGVRPEDYTRDGLDEKEKEMLGFWSQIRGMNEQINLAVTEIMRGVLTDKTSSMGNIVLVGDAGNGRTTLAISLAKIISRCRGLQTAKVAKIYAEDLNKKDIAATVSKMAGGVLIIEEAGDLDENAIAQLSMAMDFKTDSLIVVLEDERRYLQDLLARNTQFADKFTVTINVPILTNDELVEFGKYYANEKGCALDESAVTALYDSIGILQSPEQPVAILDVQEIMDKAIRHASRFGLGKLFSSLSGKRYDENDRVIMKAKNFKKIK
ncbi:MAG: hypothetical protein Q4C50_09380 [Eubacteriales bacterium]|nr:hypothetical protein [Eubacteriales bacterium]